MKNIFLYQIENPLCDNDPGSHKEVHKHWSEVGVHKDVYLEQMCK